jgi:hypothetical protein
MNPVTHTLPTVAVTGSASSPWLHDFEERRRTRFGRFITESEIRASFGSSLRDLMFRKVPGVRLEEASAGQVFVFSLRGSNSMAGTCQVAVYLNGMHLADGNAGLVPLQLLGGIEYYPPGFVPVQYQSPSAVNPQKRGESRGGSSACGVLLLWTGP